MPRVLDEVSSIGHEGTEAVLNILEKVSDPKGFLTTKGLELARIHMSLNDKLVDGALGIARKLDGQYLLFSGAGGKENTEENYRRSARLLEKIGKKPPNKAPKFAMITTGNRSLTTQWA